jgi:hypothetical protein
MKTISPLADTGNGTQKNSKNNNNKTLKRVISNE